MDEDEIYSDDEIICDECGSKDCDGDRYGYVCNACGYSDEDEDE